MVEDKLAWLNLSKLCGMGFVFWGFGNIGVYGLSKVMYQENFRYYFYYMRDGRTFQPFKSLIAADNFYNVAWTSSSLIGGGFYLQQRVGSSVAFKLFGLSLVASYLATTS